MRAWGGATLVVVLGMATPFGCSPFGVAPTSDASVSEAGPAGDDGGPALRTGYRDTVLADRPIGYWRLGEPTSSTTVADQSGAGHTGTVTACKLGVAGALAGDPDTAAEFNEATSVIDLGRVYDIHDRAPFTIEAWIAPREISAFHHVFTKQTNNDGRQGFALLVDGGGVLIERWVDGDQVKITTDAPPPLGSFTYAAATYDGDRLALFVDGVVVGSKSDQRPLKPQDVSAWIGARSAGGSAFVGSIDEVAIYDTALSPERISAHYAAGKGK